MVQEMRKRTCFFSGVPCRECLLYRGRHYFLCHPDASWESVNEPAPAGEAPWYETHFDCFAPAGVPLEELKALAGSLDWDFWPEGGPYGPEPAEAALRPHFAIDVWNGQASLRLMAPADGDRRAWVCRRLELEAPHDLLAKAVIEQGGTLLLAAAYPLNSEVKDWLRERLGVAAKP